MLHELKDLAEKNLFTEVGILNSLHPTGSKHPDFSTLQKETKLIMKKRTTFETALVRRVAKKADFLRYASYEMGLEQLRRKRVERMSECRCTVRCFFSFVIEWRRNGAKSALNIRLCTCKAAVSYI